MSISNKERKRNLAQYGNVKRVIQFLIFRTFDLRWKKFYKKVKNTVLSLPSVKVGEELNTAKKLQNMTKPPKPYTASTLEKAVENVHKLIG